MSLSGLDAAAVDAAAKTVSQERGGWFLVHYTSRDSVEVLSQGTKGINEMREAAEKYYNDTESEGATGPLFGMIDFRRRKVLVKLVTEGTTRLVKARVQVHWASVTARFPTHDSVFEPTSTDQLTESQITAHVELHSGRSSSGSNKKPLLDGISEEGTEQQQVSPLLSSKASFSAKTDDESSHQVSPLSSAGTVDHSKRITALVGNAAATSAALQRSLSGADLATVPEVSVTAHSPTTNPPSEWRPDDRRPSTDARSMVDMSDRRLSTASGRPSTAAEAASLYDFESLYKPKVKLGPRPATASRPPSKGSSAALPSGLRSSRPSSLRPKSRDSTYSAFRVPPPPPIPETSPLDFMPRPKSSGNSVKSLPATLPKSPGMTREKQRLMRFREMYKDKENKRKQAPVELPAGEAAAELSAESVASPKVDEESDMPEMRATISNPAAELPQRLSVISETSTLKSGPASTANTPHMGKENLATFGANSSIPKSTLASQTGTPNLSQETEGAFEEQEPVRTEPPRPSEDTASTVPLSSPTSVEDSSELATSTRATSVSDEAEPEKELEVVIKSPIDSVQEPEPRHSAETPTPARTEDEDSESSTPTAPPTAQAELPPADAKERRRAAVSPIVIPTDSADTDASETDGEQSYDEDLMDELDGAEVQEAFKVSVSKSPITPVFARRPSLGSMLSPSSPASIVLNGKTPSPMPSPLPPQVTRTLSTAAPAVDENPQPATTGAVLEQSVEASEKAETVQAEHAEPAPTPEAAPEQQPKIEIDEEGSDEDSETRPPTITPLTAKRISEIEHLPIAQTKEPMVSPKLLQQEEKPGQKGNRYSSVPIFNIPKRSPSKVEASSRSAVHLSATPKQQEDVSVNKRRNLGTGVAAKIADLQRNFSRGSSGSPAAAPNPTSRKSSLVSLRASSIHDPMPRGDRPTSSSSRVQKDEHLFRGRALSKGSVHSFDSRDTRMSTPPRGQSNGSIGRLDSKRFSNFNSPALEVSSKSDTIQVKATIVRTEMEDSQEGTGLGLQHTPVEAESPQIITHSDHSKAYAQPRTSIIVEEPRSPTRTSMDKKHRRARSSISSALGLIGLKAPSVDKQPADTPASPAPEGRRSARNSVEINGSWRSIRRRASSSLSRSPSMTRDIASAPGHRSPLVMTPRSLGERPAFGRNMSTSSLDSAGTADQDGDASMHKRKGSRASRMLKRMSNSMSTMLANSSEGTANPSKVETVEEEKWVGADLGEVNIQFPDTLLWKRRHLEVDTQGNLVMTANEMPNKATSIRSSKAKEQRPERKYHLSRFFPPFAPDMERMEMPYSVVLDFRDDGGTLQVAADSGLGQSSVLRVLSEAHRVCNY